MKKIKRFLAALMLCVVALSMAGCAELDEMKARHAVWGEDKETVIYNGTIYRVLTPHSMLQVWNAKDTIRVTESDVPVLLSKRYGDAMTIGKSGILLESYEWELNAPIIYCREDYYESVSKQILEGPVLSNVLYGYWDEEGENLEYFLSAQEIAAVEALLAGAPTESGIERYTLDEDFSFNLERASEDTYFRSPLCEVLVYEKEICLLKDIEADGLVEVYPVPVEQQALFEKMIEKFAMMSWTGYYYSSHPEPTEIN